MLELIDPEDGENRAVRAFLMHYGAPGLTVGQMKENMRRAGWLMCWPTWAQTQSGEHLTKAGAQDWLRHLFALEGTRGVALGDGYRTSADGMTRTLIAPDAAAAMVPSASGTFLVGADGRLRPACAHARETTSTGPTTDQINHYCADCGASWTTFPPRGIPALDKQTFSASSTGGVESED